MSYICMSDHRSIWSMLLIMYTERTCWKRALSTYSGKTKCIQHKHIISLSLEGMLPTLRYKGGFSYSLYGSQAFPSHNTTVLLPRDHCILIDLHTVASSYVISYHMNILPLFITMESYRQSVPEIQQMSMILC